MSLTDRPVALQPQILYLVQTQIQTQTSYVYNPKPLQQSSPKLDLVLNPLS
jgi:hypothetical protein